jgi:hypothetical protein
MALVACSAPGQTDGAKQLICLLHVFFPDT